MGLFANEESRSFGGLFSFGGFTALLSFISFGATSKLSHESNSLHSDIPKLLKHQGQKGHTDRVDHNGLKGDAFCLSSFFILSFRDGNGCCQGDELKPLVQLDPTLIPACWPAGPSSFLIPFLLHSFLLSHFLSSHFFTSPIGSSGSPSFTTEPMPMSLLRSSSLTAVRALVPRSAIMISPGMC